MGAKDKKSQKSTLKWTFHFEKTNGRSKNSLEIPQVGNK